MTYDFGDGRFAFGLKRRWDANLEFIFHFLSSVFVCFDINLSFVIITGRNSALMIETPSPIVAENTLNPYLIKLSLYPDVFRVNLVRFLCEFHLIFLL